MGSEAKCRVELDGRTGEAKALLETDELIVRAPFRLTIPFREIKTIEAGDDHLRIAWGSHTLSLAIGRDARKWADKIRNPKSLTDKLGIKAGQKISIAGDLPRSFLDELNRRGADVSMRMRPNSDIIFFVVDRKEDLLRFSAIRKSLASDGSLWVVRPKGITAISESDVMAAGRSAGLVDVKVARFSATHTAEKFVIPVSNRTTGRNRG
ncbi:MAG TPA: hypothetical protein VLV78_19610 [Thermoanaerobaculia bacterium]|nr:hypothetical protein [Thermoanaerobaculia bacterium]